MKGRGGGPKSRRMSEMASGISEDTMDDALTNFTLDELREFLEADLYEAPADPEFKERLRRKLWAMVQARAGVPPRRVD